MQNVIAATVAAAIVTGGAVYIAQMPKPPESEIGRFQFVKNDGNSIWNFDTKTGEVRLCAIISETHGKKDPAQGCMLLDGTLTLIKSEPDANPFDKYDTPASTPPGENPFTKYRNPPATK